MLTLDEAKAWFALHKDSILDSYGRKHHLQKADLLLIIGTLDTKDYALCASCPRRYSDIHSCEFCIALAVVNHKHPDGMAHFNM